MTMERLQKILARTQDLSRREAEKLIEYGLVTVNGKTAVLGDQADPQVDSIKVEGRRVVDKPESYLVFVHKPREVLAQRSKDPKGRRTLDPILSMIPPRFQIINRLAYFDKGLIVLTDQPAIKSLFLKSDKIRWAFDVKISDSISREVVAMLNKGYRVEGKLLRPIEVKKTEDLSSKSKLRIVLRGFWPERTVRKFLEARGLHCEQLCLSEIGSWKIKSIPSANWKKVDLNIIEEKYS